MAHAVLEDLISKNKMLKDKVFIDSCATHSFHIGSMPDYRSIKVAEENNIEIQHLRARHISPNDYEKFDLLLAMDHSHIDILENMFPGKYAKIKLFLKFSDDINENVDDPYFGGMEGFYNMFDIIEKASKNLILKLENDKN
jgi:protein-tyrosine phosphatase